MTDFSMHFPVEVASAHCEGITEQDLPPRFNRRWTPLMKARVVAAIECDILSAEEAGARYALSQEELLSWQRGLAHAGLDGLTRAGRTSVYNSVYRGGEEVRASA